MSYGERAAREMEYFQLKTLPAAVQRFFYAVRLLWVENFHAYVWATVIPIFIAWIGALLSLLCWMFPRPRFFQAVARTGTEKLAAPVIAASALLLYEDLATSLFSQPVYRYFHMTEPWRLVIAGYGLVYLVAWLSPAWQATLGALGRFGVQSNRSRVISALQRYDLLDGYFGGRRAQWIGLLVVLNVGLFAWWTSNVVAHTSGPPIEIVSATYGQSCGGVIPTAGENRIREGNVTREVRRQVCLFHRCTISVDSTGWEDPAPGCAKDLSVSYRCKDDQQPRMASIAAGASGKTVELDCYTPAPAALTTPEPVAEPGLNIRTATYGASCGVPSGNVTKDLANSCNGLADCDYLVDVERLGDPAPSCGKDFQVEYSCAPETALRRKDLPAEAGFKTSLRLSCAQDYVWP